MKTINEIKNKQKELWNLSIDIRDKLLKTEDESLKKIYRKNHDFLVAQVDILNWVIDEN